MRLRVGGWSVRVGGYKLSVGGSRLMIEGWMFIGRGVKENSLDGRVLDSSGILLENDPETPYRPKDYTSESYFKN